MSSFLPFRRLSLLLLRTPFVARRHLHRTPGLRLPSWGPPVAKVDPKDVEQRVIACLSKHDKIDAKSVTLASHLTQDLGLDSLDVIECVVHLEDEFALSVPDADAERLLSVGAVVEWVCAQLAARKDVNRRPDIEFLEGMTSATFRPMN